ncbi:hypothetical protein [Paracoccus saliphilus]|uniref:Uncharacterized protein n=1 Tax=Paracoccus saliphilus TaxID=405559 RepID=A0AA45W7Z6_9RHOB|nr:hypothetical protein [Paracoccus saliphilus]WCR04803.1 hypothetical protein JHX88_08865 [Paracoccus saliphilus]SIT12795.1 hypothetical protein SAMN05421772_12212 [Paracoccus saliphilus]
MTTSGEMVAATAELFGVSAATVESIDRALSDAGLRRKGGRGRSAAKMSGLDVVNLSFALMHGVGMKDAPGVVRKVSQMPRQETDVQRYADALGNLPPLLEQVEQYDRHPAEPSDLGSFKAGADLIEAENFGTGIAALVDAMATGQFDNAEDFAINVQMNSVGPTAKLVYRVPGEVLRVEYQTVGDDAERPVFERSVKLDEALIRRLAEIIRPG